MQIYWHTCWIEIRLGSTYNLSYVIVYLCFISEKKSEKHQVWLNEVASELKEKTTILISYTNDHFLWYEKFLAIQMTATFFYFFLSVWYSWRHKNLCVAFSKRHIFFLRIISTVRTYNVTKRYVISEMKNVRVCTECHLQRKNSYVHNIIHENFPTMMLKVAEKQQAIKIMNKS